MSNSGSVLVMLLFEIILVRSQDNISNFHNLNFFHLIILFMYLYAKVMFNSFS